MDRQGEWKKAFYEDEPKKGSKKKPLIALVIIIIIGIIAAVVYFFPSILSISGEKSLDLDIDITVEDITYSAEGIESEEMLEVYETIESGVNGFSIMIKTYGGYSLEEMVENPKDDSASELSAITYLLNHFLLLLSETGYIINTYNITDQEIVSLPIQKVDETDTSKENLLLTISYLIEIEEWYKEKGFPFSETNINRLNFLYRYFEVVEIDENEIISYQGYEGSSFGGIIKNVLKSYNMFYTNMMKRMDVLEASDNTITIKNTGREDLELADIYSDVSVYVSMMPVDCYWSADLIKQGETANCVLEDACTGEEIMIISAGGTKEIVCS